MMDMDLKKGCEKGNSYFLNETLRTSSFPANQIKSNFNLLCLKSSNRYT